MNAARTGLRAARQNLAAGLLLQSIALALILSYYLIPTVSARLDDLGSLNERWSPWLAIALTVLFGGIIPLGVEALQAAKRQQPQRSVAQLLFTLLVWGINGALTAWLYQYQASLFGSAPTVSTVIKKVLVDQFIWVPLYVVPFFTLIFLWRDQQFSYQGLRTALQERSFWDRALPLMISNWAVWIPAVSIIYAFPTSLQIILMNLILVFWSLILTIFVSDSNS